jgi:hypothetical protein
MKEKYCLTIILIIIAGLFLNNPEVIENEVGSDSNIEVEVFSIVGLSPVGHWKLNEVAVGAGSVIDAGSGANNGTPTNMENADCDQVNQKLGAACLNFDQEDAEHVTFGDVLDFDHDDPFSLDCWIKPTHVLGSEESVIHKFHDVDFQGYKLTIDGSSTNVIRFYLYASNVKFIKFDATISIPTNSYTHIIVTYDGTGTHAGVKMYINAIEYLNGGATTGDITTGTTVTTKALTISEDSSDINPFDGLIDEVAIYDVVLSHEDVKFRYNAGLGTESMDTITWDISAMTNIIKFEVQDMTLDEGIPYAILEVEDSVVPADWYIAFTGNYRFSAVTADEQFFKGIVDKSKTRRDDKTGIRTFRLDHWLKSELLHKPNATFGVAADTYEDILEDIIAADMTNMIDGGHIAGSTTTNAMTFKGHKTFHSIVKQACEADKHVAYIEANTSELFKEAPTTTQTLTWSDTTCRWMGSQPAGPRPNQVIAHGIGITSTKNATDTSFQTKYGVITVHRFKAISDQTQLDNWAQGYIDNLSADNYIIFLQLYTGYHLAPGQTVVYSSAQMVVSSDTYLIKKVRYDALTGEILKVKLSLGVGFKAPGKFTERIDENTEAIAEVLEKGNATKIGGYVHPSYMGVANGFNLGGNTLYCLNSDASANAYANCVIDTTGTYEVHIRYWNDNNTNDLAGALSVGAVADDEPYSLTNEINAGAATLPVGTINDEYDYAHGTTFTAAVGDIVHILWQKNANEGAGFMYISSIYLKRTA